MVVPVYYSRERVYELGPDGLPHRLKYPVGDPIPEEEARRQGLILADPEPVPDLGEVKAVPGPPQDKSRKPRATKTRTPDAPEEG